MSSKGLWANVFSEAEKAQLAALVAAPALTGFLIQNAEAATPADFSSTSVAFVAVTGAIISGLTSTVGDRYILLWQSRQQHTVAGTTVSLRFQERYNAGAWVDVGVELEDRATTASQRRAIHMSMIRLIQSNGTVDFQMTAKNGSGATLTLSNCFIGAIILKAL